MGLFLLGVALGIIIGLVACAAIFAHVEGDAYARELEALKRIHERPHDWAEDGSDL
jgi:hypothetical protein